MIKSWMESLLIALSMYSALPVKCLNWTEKNLRNAMVFFPLVGLLCGVGLFVVWTACELLHVGAVLFGVLAVLSGVLITGKTVAQRVGDGVIPMYTLSGEWVCEKRGERASAPVTDAAAPALSGEGYIRCIIRRI